MQSMFINGDDPKTKNRQVSGKAKYDRQAPAINQRGEIRMLVVALDYKKTDNPLTASVDAKNMEDLARQSGVRDVTSLYDEQCSTTAVTKAIKQVGASCGPEDVFVFYFAGHGTNVADHSGDEADGEDSAFVLVDKNGQFNTNTLLIDDFFSECVVRSVRPEARIVILTDCCHSGTIADLDDDKWSGRHAISITGCLDKETSGDTGKGGIMTHSLLLAIDKLARCKQHDYSVGALYNATLWENHHVFQGSQHITIEAAPNFSPDQMAWPLSPPPGYLAPLNRHAPGQPAASPLMTNYAGAAAANFEHNLDNYVTFVHGAELNTVKRMRHCAGMAGIPCQDGCVVQ